MRVDSRKLREFALQGAICGAMVGIVGSMFWIFSSPLLLEFNFLFGSILQASLQLCLGGIFGLLLGALTLAIATPTWNSEVASVLQTFLAPTVFIVIVAVGVLSFEGTLPPIQNEFLFQPLAGFIVLWMALCVFISIVGLLASVGSRGFGD
ncbi:MAG: hypothetical protein DKT66_09775 [Candidatus Melainabacteria bacterium]|nr:MAG: hypothetical protein DKT66_09775 [Candidatus Melainabacteria bacterium]